MNNLNDLPKEERFKALRKEKNSLIQQKLADKKFSDPVNVLPTIKPKETKTKPAKKADGVMDDTIEDGVIDVSVVCNTAWFLDSQLDVLTDKAYDSTIAAGGVVHIHDHEWSVAAHVGDVQKVYKQLLPLKDLGLDREGATTALVMDSRVRKDYHEKVFNFYQAGKINQHSIGFRYVDIRLAMDSNDPYDAAEKALWDETYPKLINQDLADNAGYFWLVGDVKIYENSCVLFGANALTPTLATSNLKFDTPIEKEQDMTDEQLKALFAEMAKAVGESVASANKPVLEALEDLKTALAESAKNESLETALSKVTEAIEKTGAAYAELMKTLEKIPAPSKGDAVFGVNHENVGLR